MKRILTSALLVLLLLGAILPSFVNPQPVYAATETLRPNAAGDETGLFPSGEVDHWACVDEAVADDETTYVYTASSTYLRDLYNLPAHSGSGTINSITIYFRIAGGVGNNCYAMPSQKSGTTTTDGTEQNQYGSSFVTKSQTYTSNPATGLAYTWDEIDTFQIGVKLKTDGAGIAKCTQVYVEVDYTLSGPSITTNAASSVEEITATLNGEVTAINDTSITQRGFVWDTSTHGEPGNVAPASSGYANNWTESGTFGIEAFDSKGDTLLYEYYNTGDDSSFIFNGTIWGAQTFTPSFDHKITSVKLLLRRFGSPGTITVGIRATSGGHPTGGDLCSGTTDGDTLPTVPYEWREITLGTGYDLTADIKYAIVFRATSGNSSNYVRWRVDNTSPTYDGGNFEYSSSSGIGWISYNNSDLMFEEWGEEIACSSLTEGELYYVRACAKNDLNNWAYGDEVTFLTKPDPPSTFTATAVDEDQIDLAWTNGDGADKVYIRGKLGSAPTNRTDGAYSWNGTGTTTSHTGLSAGQHWYYIIWSYVTEGALEQTSDTPDLDDDATIISPPTVLSVMVEGTGSYEYGRWVILRGEVDDDAGLILNEVGFEYGLTTGYGQTATMSGSYETGVEFVKWVGVLSPGTTYHWRAYATDGMVTGYGADMTFTTLGSSVLYEYWNTGQDDDSSAIYAGNWTAQYFTVDATSHSVTAVRVYLKRVGSPGTVTLSIKHVDESFKPTGADICSGTYDGDVLSTGYNWVEFTVDTASLEAETAYAIAVRAVAGDGSNYVLWGGDAGVGLDDAFGWSSTDGGVAWSSDSPMDYLFEIRGYSLLDVVNAAVFRGFIEDDDMLFVLDYENAYPPYYPDMDCPSYFSLRLYGTDGTTLLASTSCREWGRKPGSIYLSANQANSLTEGAAYYIKLVLNSDTDVVSSYQLQSSDWKGTDLSGMDRWCITLAHSIETYYYEVFDQAIDLTSMLVDSEVLNEDGGVLFITGIPGLDQVRTGLFAISESTPGYTPSEGTLAPGADWTEEVGPDVEDIINTSAGWFQVDGKVLGGFGIIGFYLLAACFLVPRGKTWQGDVAIGLGLAIPCMIGGWALGFIDFVYIAVPISGLVFLWVYSMFWSRT